MSTAAVLIAAIEEAFKRYIIVCEYLQIDPCEKHDKQVIQERSKQVLLSADGLDEKKKRRLKKDLEWFEKRYDSLVGNSWRCYGFIKRSKKLVKKGYLQAFTAENQEFTPKELTRQNYDYFVQKSKKEIVITLAISLGALVVCGIILLIVLL